MQAHFDLNVFGAFRVCKAVLPHMANKDTNQRKGLVINIGSIVGNVCVLSHLKFVSLIVIWLIQTSTMARCIFHVQRCYAHDDGHFGLGVSTSECERDAG